jgi:hypothetical protein
MFETKDSQRQGDCQLQLNLLTLMFSMVFEVIFSAMQLTDQNKTAQKWPKETYPLETVAGTIAKPTYYQQVENGGPARI